MTTDETKAALARIGEILRKPNENAADAREVGALALGLLEDFLLDHKRQTELLEGIASTGEFFEHQRREGRG